MGILKLSMPSDNVQSVHRGIYESLLTNQLIHQLKQQDDLQAEYGTVDEAEQALAVARHLAPIIEGAMRSARTAEDRVELVQRILEVLPDPHAVGEALYQVEPGKLTRLEQLVSATKLGDARLPRPATPFCDAALMTNARNEPTLAAELRAELVSADHVDLLCAFIKWQGLRLLEDQLNELRRRGIPLRVITTTYLGATDARALDALVNDFGAEVRVNYETDRTRLHAKAWLSAPQHRFSYCLCRVQQSVPCRACGRIGMERPTVCDVDTPSSGEVPGHIRLLLGK